MVVYFSNERAGKVYRNNQVIINKQFYGIMTLNRRWMCVFICGFMDPINWWRSVSIFIQVKCFDASLGDVKLLYCSFIDTLHGHGHGNAVSGGSFLAL